MFLEAVKRVFLVRAIILREYLHVLYLLFIIACKLLPSKTGTKLAKVLITGVTTIGSMVTHQRVGDAMQSASAVKKGHWWGELAV